jgi:hypothetical protein
MSSLRITRLSSPLLTMALSILLASPCGAWAKDAFVVISGGGSPLSNHYSQYLQARAYATYLHAHYADDSIWTFFGAGNRSGQAPVLFDVEQTERDIHGSDHTRWIAGALPDNRPARHDDIARAFRDEILPRVKNGGTVYLFVGDHGGPSSDSRGESIISLWSWDRDPSIPFGWRSYGDSQTLGVAELRRWLSAGLGRGRVVFVMSQCYSGGFHYLGLPRVETPDPAWFTSVPEWARSSRPASAELPVAAGYTATDDQSFASGCTSDVSADNWAGYERYMPEQLTGLDMFTLKTGAAPARSSFHQAHVQAVLADQTIDKPRATSEQYLHDWAQTLSRMQDEPAVAATVKPALAHFRQVMDGAAPQVADAPLQARADEFRQYTERMAQNDPDLKKLIGMPQAVLEAVRQQAKAASSADYRTARTADEQSDEASGTRALFDRLWTRTIEPAWQKALAAGQLPQLPAPVLAYERDIAHIQAAARMSAQGADGRSPLGMVDADFLPYFESGYGDPASFDAARANVVAQWSDRRYRTILDWAKKSGDPKLSGAAAAMAFLLPPDDADASDASDAKAAHAALVAPSKPQPPKPRRLDRATAIERILLYRQVLASWQFLLETHEKPALERLAALIAVEQSPLPVAR